MPAIAGSTRNERLGRLLHPRSIAVIGASDKPGSLGASVIANLDRAGFPGEVYLVNPKRDRIGERPCHATVDDLPAGIDAAILAIPQAMVVDTLRALARKDAGAAVVYAAGFAEGGEAGMAQQEEIRRIAQETGLVVEGPNCLGLVNFSARIPLTFIELPEPRADGPRKLAVISQSGAMAAVVATNMIGREVPLSCYVSTGNEAVCGIEDFLEVMLDDAETQVFALMAEHVRDPQRFLAVARRAVANGKPVVLLHPGRSAAGRASAATHTGAMVGDYDTMEALVTQAGIILVDSLEELNDVAEMLLRCPGLSGHGLAVIAESGALKALTLDQAEALGLALSPLGEGESPALRAALPPFVPVTNPLDITAQGLVDPGIYTRTIAALDRDERVETIVIDLIQTDARSAGIKIRAVCDAVRAMTSPKPVIVAGVDEGGRVRPEDISEIRALGVPYFPTPERVLRSLARVARAAPKALDEGSGGSVTLAGLASGQIIPEYRAKAALAPHGVAFSPSELVPDLAGARAAAARLGYPVVLKAQSAALAHKTEAGGVILNIGDEPALEAAWQRLAGNIAHHRPGLVLDGVLVEAMAGKGVEMILGAKVDPDWGPVIMAGFGGVAAELLRDKVLITPGMAREQVRGLLLSLRMAPLLTGFRGAPPADLEAFVEMILALGAILRGTPEIREIDLNPVLVFPAGGGAAALDALIYT